MVKLGDLTHPSVEGFWAFIEEREAVRLRKDAGEDAETWTDDPTLSKFHFCNVRRADDHGTKWYMERIGYRGVSTISNAELLWQTCFYRLVNNTRWFEKLSPEGFVSPDFVGEEGWRARVDACGTPSNLAYRNLTSSKNPTWTRLRRLKEYLQRTAKARWLEPYNLSVLDGGDIIEPEELWKRLQAFPGIGAFTGLQVYRDLLLAGVLPFSEDDWTYIGPGADEGVKLLMETEGCKHLPNPSYDERYSFLLGLRESKANTLNLVLGDVEHDLCEYAKYTKFRQGKGKMRKYAPHGIN